VAGAHSRKALCEIKQEGDSWRAGGYLRIHAGFEELTSTDEMNFEERKRVDYERTRGCDVRWNECVKKS
jgi:hypothetical protein